MSFVRFNLLDKYIFSDGAWSFSPATLNRLVYSEWESSPNAAWAYNPPPRHDIPMAEIAAGIAQQELDHHVPAADVRTASMICR